MGVTRFIHKKASIILPAMLVAALLLAGISMQVALAQEPGGYYILDHRFKGQCYYPTDSPEATPQPMPLEEARKYFKIGAFPTPESPPQPNTQCWDQREVWFCWCETHQYWEYWCHRCCNEPDYCPTGCCDIYCWWVEAGTCSC